VDTNRTILVLVLHSIYAYAYAQIATLLLCSLAWHEGFILLRIWIGPFYVGSPYLRCREVQGYLSTYY